MLKYVYLTRKFYVFCILIFNFSSTEIYSQRVKKIIDIGKEYHSNWGDSKSPTGVETASIGDVFFFTMENVRYGRELWRSDGTEIGTYLVKDIYSGIYGSSPDLFLVHGEILYFMASSEIGRALWRSDGTKDGTFMVKMPIANSSITFVTAVSVNDYFFFTMDDGQIDGQYYYETLWRSDGTEFGTQMVEGIINSTGSEESSFASFFPYNGRLYFSKFYNTGKFQIYSTDGVINGETLVKEFEIGSTFDRTITFFQLNGELYFGSNIGLMEGIWKTDGTALGTYRIAEQGYLRKPGFVELNGYSYFFTRQELWKTNGSADGTYLVKTFDLGSSIQETNRFLKKSSNLIYFNYKNSYAEGSELWCSDGSEFGTFLVKSIEPGSQSPHLLFPTIFNDNLYFTATNDDFGREIWMSNGTYEGTELLKETVDGTKSLNPHALFTVNNTLYFFDEEFNVWKSSGTSSTTNFSFTSKTNNTASTPVNFTNFKDETYFLTDALWKTDGTTEGTVFVSEAFRRFLSKTDDYLFYFLSDRITSFDGTVTNDIWNYSYGDYYHVNFISKSLHNQFIFSAFDIMSKSYRLYRTDGTANSAILIKEFYPDEDVYIENIAEGNGILYFTVRDKTELWRTDGTTAGTFLLKDDIRIEEPMITVNGILYFNCDFNNNGFRDYELWKSDGSLSGTEIVYDSPLWFKSKTKLTQVNDLIFYCSTEGGYPNTIYQTDGTSVGTFKIDFPESGELTTLVAELYALNQDLIFVTYSSIGDGAHSFYKLNTNNNEVTLINTIGNVELFNVSEGIEYNDYIYFSAKSANMGSELWRTDGETINLVKKISYSWRGSNPKSFFKSNGSLYFVADDRIHGEELYKLGGCGEEENLSIDEEFLPGYIIEKVGENFIESSSTLFHTSTVNYESGNFIMLNPGFETKEDVYFKAKIVPCE